ncbi:MAG: family 43 glycosylhydrolase [Clostridia bacterium]|nr:family 43 glycosylhydrolase [Clostridia bacterium]
MKRKSALILSLLLAVCTLACCQSGDPPPSPDSTTTTLPEQTQAELTDDKEQQGVPMENVTTYQNPLLDYQSDHAWRGYGFGDPFVMRYNGTYYLYVSTKDGSVGIKCWSSPDLVNWTYEGLCSQDPVTKSAYAPEVYYYNGYFYMYTSPAGNGHYVLRSTYPTKDFKVVTDNMGMSIDGSVFIDNDGKWYFYTAGHGALKVYDMVSPTQMRRGTSLSCATVNGAWTEGAMVVYHDGYYYLTYTGNHVLSPSYRILYGVSDSSPLNFDSMPDQNPLLISTAGDILGIGHSSTVKGPDLDSYYIVYHALLDTMPNRTMNIDRIVFNGKKMEIVGPTVTPQQVPDMPDVYHHFAPGSSLKGWSLIGSLTAGSGGLCLTADSKLVCKTPFLGDFTAEYNVTSIAQGSMAGALFAYTDAENFGACYFSPDTQKLIIEFTVAGETTRTEADTVRSFGEDTRFDCLQALQIERSGSTYTFYMNDRLVCTVKNSDLVGGAIGYISKGGEASFGFIGGTGAVGGYGAADQFTTVSDKAGFIPAYQATKAPETLTSAQGERVVPMYADTALCYRILAAESGSYDLALLCHDVKGGAAIELYVDDKSVGTYVLDGSDQYTNTAVLRTIPLSKGQHVITIKLTSGSLLAESLTIRKGEAVTQLSLTFENDLQAPAYQDGGWEIKNGTLRTSDGSRFGKVLYGSPNWGDYQAQVTLTPSSSPNCGLLVRATNPGNPAFLGTQPSHNDAVTATDWVQGYFVGLTGEGVILGKQGYGYTELARADGQFRAGKAYTLKVICTGARIQVYVDGTLYLDYTDPDPYMQGMVGIRTHNCFAAFDNLLITPAGQ